VVDSFNRRVQVFPLLRFKTTGYGGHKVIRNLAPYWRCSERDHAGRADHGLLGMHSFGPGTKSPIAGARPDACATLHRAALGTVYGLWNRS